MRILVAAVLAARVGDVHEVSAWASTALGKEALSRAGFRLRGCEAVSLFGDARILGGRQLHVQMLDSAKDLNDAIKVASRIPSAKSGSIEVRPVVERPA